MLLRPLGAPPTWVRLHLSEVLDADFDEYSVHVLCGHNQVQPAKAELWIVWTTCAISICGSGRDLALVHSVVALELLRRQPGPTTGGGR